MYIEGVWATPVAEEEFSEAERRYCIGHYREHGPNKVIRGVGFAFYDFYDGRALVLVDNNGKVSVMTEGEIEEASEDVVEV